MTAGRSVVDWGLGEGRKGKKGLCESELLGLRDVSIFFSTDAFICVYVKAYHVILKDEWFVFVSYASVRLALSLSPSLSVGYCLQLLTK